MSDWTDEDATSFLAETSLDWEGDFESVDWLSDWTDEELTRIYRVSTWRAWLSEAIRGLGRNLVVRSFLRHGYHGVGLV